MNEKILSNNHHLSVGIFGTLPGPDQSVARSELFAVVETLRLAVKPLHIRTDHLNITLGIDAGAVVTTAARFPNADLWRRIWHYIHEHGGLDDSLTITWVPGHDSRPSLDALGNRWADKLAKMGAQLHDLPKTDLDRTAELRTTLLATLRWIGRAAALFSRPGMPPSRTPKSEWPVRTTAERRALYKQRCNILDRERGVRREPLNFRHTQFVTRSVGAVVAIKLARTARLRMRDEELAHEQNLNLMIPPAALEDSSLDANCIYCNSRRKLVFLGGIRSRAPCLCLRLKRRRLLCKQTDSLGVFNHMYDAYSGPSNTPVARRDAGGHILFTIDELTFCFSCGSYSTERVHHLSGSCRGHPGDGQAYRLGRLKRGRHPLTNIPLDGPVQRLMAH